MNTGMFPFRILNAALDEADLLFVNPFARSQTRCQAPLASHFR